MSTSTVNGDCIGAGIRVDALGGGSKMKRISLVLGLLWTGFVAFGQDPWVYRGNPNWDKSWNQRPFPRAGACFFTDSGFRGDRFCVNRGDRLDRLPENFGDNISSIQLFGNARARVFNDRNFSGGSQEFQRSIGDLRTARFRDGHTWNNRISSLIVR
jgi:peptidase inhibitor family I36